MSNRAFYIVAGIATAALVAVLIASYQMRGLTLAPASVGLFAILFAVPLAFFLRWLPLILLANVMPSDLRERMADYRDSPASARRAARICWAALLLSYLLVLGTVALYRNGIPDWIIELIVFVWFGLFLLGWLGLFFNSQLVQKNAALLAFLGVPVVILSIVLLVWWAKHQFLGNGFMAVPVVCMLTGVLMISAPFFVYYLRTLGLID